MKIRTIDEANMALSAYVPLVAHTTGKDITLERVFPLMELFDNPQDKLKIVHIAGTSGKTSTAYYTAALLTAANLKIGLTVSPHIDSVTERVQLDGQPVADEQFCKYLEQFLTIIEASSIEPTYFELLYAFAIWVFAKEQVDYAVVETGLGGLHDASNVATATNKLCIITDIGYDHMHVLGHTLPEIALQKIGIVHSGNTALTYRQTPEILAVFKKWSAEHAAKLVVIEPEQQQSHLDTKTLQAMPTYQQRNWLLAYAAYQWLANRDKLLDLAQSKLALTQAVQVPARMDILQLQSKTVVMDGAHNQQKMQALVSSFQAKFPAVQPAILVALKDDKAYKQVAPVLLQLGGPIIVTTFTGAQDLPVQAINPQIFADYLTSQGAQKVAIEFNPLKAYAKLLECTADVVLITGSFYLLAQLRRSIRD
jgi:dihydrofolate synthase/folylpolyglutamate synthase